MRRVVVTGAGGMLGQFVVRAVAHGGDHVVGLDLRAAGGCAEFHAGSILDPGALETCFAGADCVLHIAAAANIGAASPQGIIELNVQGSCNVLEAAVRTGVRRVVLCSSDSVMGNTVWPDHFWRPHELPVREDHELRPTDPYALSKLLAEEAGRAYARRGLEILALRPVFVLFPSMMGEVRARHCDPAGYRGPSAGGHVRAGGGLCWHHVDPRDVAEAFRLAIDSNYTGFEAFWLAAPSTLHPQPTLEILRSAFGRLPDRLDASLYERRPFAPMFDTERAEQRLGWRPAHDHRHDVFSTERTGA
jgi:nucleoside-diphosphate-sugar epimerase